MTGKTYKSVLYHIVFTTKESQPFLDKEIKEQVYHFIWNKCKKLGFFLHRIGGIESHVHLLIYIPPKISVSDAVGRLKGSSSYFVNQELSGGKMLYWQEGYGVITVSKNDFQRIYNYIENQEKHHGDKTTWNDYEVKNFGS